MAASDDAQDRGPAAVDELAAGVPAATAGSRPSTGRDGDVVPGPDGWVRVLLALVVGVVAGALIALLLPRDDGPRRARSADPGSTADRGSDGADG